MSLVGNPEVPVSVQQLADVIRREVRLSADIPEGQEFRCDWVRVAKAAVGNPRREYVVAYVALSGNICPMITKNTPTVLLEYAERDAEAMRSPEDEAEVFVAYRDVPAWQRLDAEAEVGNHQPTQEGDR